MDKCGSWRNLLYPTWAYYQSNPCGGNLHVVLDDANIDAGNVQSCLEWAEMAGDAEGAALARLLLTASLTQRDKLVRNYHLYRQGAPTPNVLRDPCTARGHESP
jgi:hypothetical protein